MPPRAPGALSLRMETHIERASGSVLWREEFRFTIEPMKVRELAAATRDHDDAYQGWPKPKRVPLIFPAAIAQMAGRPHITLAAGLDVSRSLHAEEEVECFRPLRVDDEFVVRSETTNAGVVVGKRAGAMRRIVTTSLFYDTMGDNLVARVKRSIFEGEHPVTTPGDLEQERLRLSDPGIKPPPDPLPADRLDPATLRVGDESPQLVIDPVTRTDFVRYAGASGDFTAIHFDEMIAARAGLPAPFAMGMLSAGFLSHLLTSWIDIAGPYALRTRFVSPMFPGDAPRCRGVVVERDESTMAINADARSGGRIITTARLQIPIGGGA